MFPFAQTFPTPKEHTPGINAKQFVILHHTGTGKDTQKGVLDGLNKRADFASCHFFVDQDGNAYKMGSPDDILWHAGESRWGKQVGMNPVSLGIEIQGPLGIETTGPDGKKRVQNFNDAQRKTVRALVQHLMAVYGIPSENVLRHADITHAKSKDGILWDGKSPSRKVDVADGFWKIDRTQFVEYQRSLIPKAV